MQDNARDSAKEADMGRNNTEQSPKFCILDGNSRAREWSLRRR